MNINKMIGSILLISCITIGGGVLALPTNTVMGGFYPSSAVFILCWFFMTISAFYMLEVTLWSKSEINLISMASNNLGTAGKMFAWVVYLLLLYALICAYLTGSSAWVIALVKKYLKLSISQEIGIPLLALGTGIFIFLGTHAADWLNRLLAFGLFVAYIILIIIGLPHVNTQLIHAKDITTLPTIIPLIITTFGYSIIIPSMTNYLERNKKQLIICITIGSLIPLGIYLLWEYVTLGILSISGPYGLEQLSQTKANSTEVAIALEKSLGNRYMSFCAKLFSIFALLTSLVGVSLSLFDFLADGLQFPKKGGPGVMLFLLTFATPMLFIFFFPAGFDRILSFGGIFVALLLGILPISMIWTGRYIKKHPSQFTVFGGKPLLLLSSVFFIYVIVQEVINFTF